VAAIVHGGLAVDWNADAARDLAAAIEARDDVRIDEIQEVTAETAKASSPNRGQVREMLTAIAPGVLAAR
jgi:hypothetical protein